MAIVIHNYRFRLGLEPGHPSYAALERRLASLPQEAPQAFADAVLALSRDGSTSARDDGGYCIRDF